MDASRLLEVLDDIEEEVEGGLIRLLSALVQQYTAARDSPTVDNTPTVQASLLALFEYIDGGIFPEYPPSKTGILKVIGGDSRVGPGLKSRIENLLSTPGQTAASIVTSLTSLQSEVSTFKKSCGQVRVGLKALGITPHLIPQGRFEVGVLMPESLVDDELSSLIKELDVWNKIVRAFQEVAGEEEREVNLAGLASGSYETYLSIGMVAARYLAMTVDKVFEWYQKVLEVRRLRQELKDLGAPIAETNVIAKHEKEIVDNGIDALVNDIVKQAHQKLDGHRKQELETQLTISIKQITRFVDRGGNVEVVSTPLGTPEEPEPISEDTASADDKKKYDRLQAEYTALKIENDKLMAINRAGSALRRLPPRPEPILQLEMDLGDEQADKSGKAPKKKPERPGS